MELPGIELGKEREQLWPEMKKKPEKLDSCFNTLKSNSLYYATLKTTKGVVRVAGKMDY